MLFKKIKKWLEGMAERNEARYGNQRLDCCGMNRQAPKPAAPATKTAPQSKAG